MPKVRLFPAASHFAVALILWSIGGICGLASVGCNQERPQELNPPADSVSGPGIAEAKAASPLTQPLAATPAAPASPAPTHAPVPATTPVAEAATAPAAVTPPTETAAVPLPPTTVPTVEAAAAPAGSPATNSADSAQSRPTARSFTGTLHGGVVAAGSETTGWALHVDGGTGDLDIDVTAISGQVKALDGRHVTITGQVKEKDWPALNGVERGKTQLLIADTIAVAPLPDMNK